MELTKVKKRNVIPEKLNFLLMYFCVSFELINSLNGILFRIKITISKRESETLKRFEWGHLTLTYMYDKHRNRHPNEHFNGCKIIKMNEWVFDDDEWWMMRAKKQIKFFEWLTLLLAVYMTIFSIMCFNPFQSEGGTATNLFIFPIFISPKLMNMDAKQKTNDDNIIIILIMFPVFCDFL
jgi:hypothetical protein